MHLIAHWLAINGEQSTINENPIIEKSIQATVHLGSQKLSSKISHILSTVKKRSKALILINKLIFYL